MLVTLWTPSRDEKFTAFASFTGVSLANRK